MHFEGSRLFFWLEIHKCLNTLPPCGTSEDKASTYRGKQWLSVSTSLFSPIFLPNQPCQKADLNEANLHKWFICNFQPFELPTASPYEWGFSIIFTSGHLGYCVSSGWLIPHSAPVAYHYLVHRQNTHWIQMRMPTDLGVLRNTAALWCKQHDH